jgi:hypothetical protein
MSESTERIGQILEQAGVYLEPDGNSLTFLQKVYRNSVLPLHTRMRAAMAALPHEVPKLSASTLVTYDGDFAKRLDLAIERANGHAKLIEGKVVESPSPEGSPQHPASELTKPLPTPLASPLRRRA